MELQNIDAATSNFLQTQDLLKAQLKVLTLNATQGVSETDQSGEDKPVSELIKPSIFDTEEIKKVKAIMTEVQEYIAEIKFNKDNKEALAEAKKKQESMGTSNVPEGFGKPQPNADQFKTVTFTVKPKKRTHQEMAKTSTPSQDKIQDNGTETDQTQASKKPKLDEEAV